MKAQMRQKKRYAVWFSTISSRGTYAAGRWEKGVNSHRYSDTLRLSSVSWKFTTTVSWLTVAWKRAKFAACREETFPTADGVRPIHRGVVPRVLAWRAAKIKKAEKEHVGGSAAICQYGNKAGSLSPSFSFPPTCILYHCLSLSRTASI